MRSKPSETKLGHVAHASYTKVNYVLRFVEETQRIVERHGERGFKHPMPVEHLNIIATLRSCSRVSFISRLQIMRGSKTLDTTNRAFQF